MITENSQKEWENEGFWRQKLSKKKFYTIFDCSTLRSSNLEQFKDRKELLIPERKKDFSLLKRCF
jgi:hypothetical protein